MRLFSLAFPFAGVAFLVGNLANVAAQASLVADLEALRLFLVTMGAN